MNVPTHALFQTAKRVSISVTGLGSLGSHVRWNDMRYINLCCPALRHAHMTLQVRGQSLCPVVLCQPLPGDSFVLARLHAVDHCLLDMLQQELCCLTPLIATP